MRWDEVNWEHHGLIVLVRWTEPVNHRLVMKEMFGEIVCPAYNVVPHLRSKDGLTIHTFHHRAHVFVLGFEYPKSSETPTRRPIAVAVMIDGRELLFKPEEVKYVYTERV